MTSVFSGICWRCWPKLCKCAPTTDEVEAMRGEIFLLDRELQRENRRAREFTDTIKGLAVTVDGMINARLADGGEDAVPHDLIELRARAREAAHLLDEDRNTDRVSGVYASMHQGGRS